MRLGFALEYSLGHATHAQNLKRTLEGETSVRSIYIDLPFYDTPGTWAKLPGVRSNWSVRASLGAYLALRPQARSLDGALFHTQVTSLFCAGLMRHLPSVVSLDATPLQYDALGAFYGHTPSASSRLEALKKRMNQRSFAAARHLVTWSEWAKESLVADYGVPAGKVTVIPPGIDTEKWNFPRRTARSDEPIHLLFVGGDFMRKGGDTLLAAFGQLPHGVKAHLHIVTKTDGAGDGVDNVTVHRGVASNSEPLLRLFAQADLFVFPTRGDCLPLAVMEALAAGLPVITTAVGALPEAVTHGETGWVAPPDDAPALTEAIAALAADPALRTRLGKAAREAAVLRFDAATNYKKLVSTVKEIAAKT
jgi:glycosyltransferase involved in cell wall biosynthesis